MVERCIRSHNDLVHLHRKEDIEKRRRISLRRLLFNFRGDCGEDEDDILLCADRELLRDSFDSDLISSNG